MLTITAKFKQEDKQDQAIESLTAEIEKFYQPITKSEFKKQIEKLRACFQTRNKYLESLDLGISRVWLDTPNKRIKHRRLVSFTQ